VYKYSASHYENMSKSEDMGRMSKRLVDTLYEQQDCLDTMLVGHRNAGVPVWPEHVTRSLFLARSHSVLW